MWSTITKNLLNWRAEFNQLITRVCICELCLEPADHSGFLCTPCRCELPRNLTACSQCAEPLTIAGRCGRCQKTPPAFDYTLSPFLYEGVTALWTRKAKDRRKTKAMKQLNWLIAEHAPPLPQSADGLVAVPSSRLRMLIRGFNPAQELAGSLGKRQGLPVLETGIKRASAIDQRALNAHQRRSNQKQAFIRSDQRFDGKHLIIVDDVMTTGATADALATQLKQQGARIVGVCTLLRTPQR
jgi:ComF family protein